MTSPLDFRVAGNEISQLAAQLAALAVALEPLNGAGRSAAVWALGEVPALVFAGDHALKSLLDEAARRLAAGEEDFELLSEPGVLGKVFVCCVGEQRAAYGLFLKGAGQPHLNETIARLIAAGEAAIGKTAAAMTRDEKQDLVKFLEARGAFLIRKGVDEVAARLGVTRFTIYNYLQRTGPDAG